MAPTVLNATIAEEAGLAFTRPWKWWSLYSVRRDRGEPSSPASAQRRRDSAGEAGRGQGLGVRLPAEHGQPLSRRSALSWRASRSPTGPRARPPWCGGAGSPRMRSKPWEYWSWIFVRGTGVRGEGRCSVNLYGRTVIWAAALGADEYVISADDSFHPGRVAAPSPYGRAEGLVMCCERCRSTRRGVGVSGGL